MLRDLILGYFLHAPVKKADKRAGVFLLIDTLL